MAGTVLDLDFSGAPPKQGGGGITFVPPGPYVLRVTDAEMGESSQSNSQAIITFAIAEGTYTGEELKDYFSPVPPLPGKMGGLQKLHALLVALGFKVQQGKAKLDLSKLIGKTCTANIATDQMQATAQYPNPRDVSKIRSYEMPTGHTAPVSPATNGATASAAAAAPTPIRSAGATAVADAPEPVEEGVTVDADNDDPFA